MSSFERALEHSLEALRQGQSIDHCLRAYPEHAEALRPHLLAATGVSNAYASAAPADEFARDARARFLVASGEALQQAFEAAAPREEFAGAARERFLVATGERLTEAFDNDPSPSFFASARVRVLMTAHRMRQSAGEAPQRRRIPSLMPGLRAATAIAAVFTIFFGLSTYTVASADSALPGDWQYSIKLKTEQVRLAFAFSDGAKRDVRIHRARERANEIAELAKNGESIGPSELHRLAAQTRPLVDDVGSDWDSGDIAKLEELTATQQQVLANAEAQVEPAAKDELNQAQDVAKSGLVKAASVRARNPGPPIVITPSLKLTATSEPAASVTPAAGGSPVSAAGTAPSILTPVGSTPTATADASTPTSTTTALPPIGGTPTDAVLAVTWIKVSFGRITAFMPSPKDGWYIQGLNSAETGSVPVPTLLHLSNVDATSLVTINAVNGDVYWHFHHDGRFDEVQLRINKDGQVLVVDRDIITAAYGHAADIPLHILDSVQLAPPPPASAPASLSPAP